MLDTVLRDIFVFSTLILKALLLREADTVVIPILQIKTLRRER